MDIWIIIKLILALSLLGVFIVANQHVAIWVRCLLSGAPLPLPVLIAMSIRRSPVEKITSAYIRCVNAGIELDIAELEQKHIVSPDEFDLYVETRIKMHQENEDES